MISGWYDIFLEPQLGDFMKMKSMAPEPAQSGTRIIIGPWGHANLGWEDANKGARSLALFSGHVRCGLV